MPAALGYSVEHALAMNTISVPRKAGDASGALMALTADGGRGRKITVNVEYNQLDALIKCAPLCGSNAGLTQARVASLPLR